MDGAGPASARPRSDRWAPVLLVALAITFPELLTGSTPFLSIFVNPLALPGLVGLYGAGVLVIREFRVRGRAGWPSLLLVGASYGVLEEGFAARTFFAPAALVGRLATYGHFASVNWVWAVQIATFHAVFSIALPILLVDVAYPSTRGRSFLSGRATGAALAVLFATVGLLAAFLNPGVRPPLAALAIVALIGLALLGAGVRLRDWRLPSLGAGAPSPGRLVALGAAWTTSFFLLNWVGPVLLPVPGLLVAIEAAVGVGVLVLALRAGGTAWTGRATVALAAGLLSFLLLFAGVLEISGDWGVGVAVAGVLALLWILYRRETRPVPSPAPPPGASGPVAAS